MSLLLWVKLWIEQFSPLIGEIPFKKARAYPMLIVNFSFETYSKELPFHRISIKSISILFKLPERPMLLAGQSDDTYIILQN